MVSWASNISSIAWLSKLIFWHFTLVFQADGHTMYLLIYVDDLILTGDNATNINQFIEILSHQFSIKDLKFLTYFLGVEVVPKKHGQILS